MTLPVTPVVLPKDLVGQPNGLLDPSLMVALHERGSLHHTAARAWRALVAECGKQGLPLTFIYGGMYRTYAEQESLFRQRYTTSYISGASRKWWNGQWWYLRPGNAMAAVPGTSNHGLGLAIDAAFDNNPSDGLGPDDATYIANHPQFNWWVANVGRFGFSFEAQSEPWHIRYVAGDNIPQAVLAWEGSVIPQLPPFNPEKGEYGLWPFIPKATAKLGDGGDRVRYLRAVVRDKVGVKVPYTGRFDRALEKVVIDLQKSNKLPVDGIVGKKTWAVIDDFALGKAIP